MPYLIMRLMAPLMSFGATLVDQNGPTLPFPGRSLLTGLIGNALGWRHGDTTQLQRLQNHLQHGVRADRRPGTITDYQTADLGQDFLVAKGWTTRGRREDRGKGAATTGTHIRYRDYLADGAFTVALTVPPEADVILETIAAALHRPARPLFIGRKPCLPSVPIVGEPTAAVIDATDMATALRIPACCAETTESHLNCWVPDPDGDVEVCDTRDWASQLHVGRTRYRHDRIPAEEICHAY